MTLLHVHLLPRFPGTPREYWWTRVEEWPEARRGSADDIAALVQDLHAHITMAGQRSSVPPSKST